MNSILHSIKSMWGMMRKILEQYRAYYLPGLITFLVFFGISNVLNFSFSYMGNTNPEVAKAILVNFWGTILLQILKVLIAYGVIGALLGALVFCAVIEAGQTFHRSPGRRTAAGFTVGILVFSTMLQFCEKIIINPQLYVENFASHSWLFLSFQMFLTDNIHPLVFSVPLYIIMLLVVCFALKPVALREVKALFTRIISFRFRWYAAGVICVMIIFMVLYQQRVIFYEEDRRPNILILSSDAVRSDHFSANGYSRSTTPNIDRVINCSLQFRGVMTAVPRTFPSWVSILTSQYPLSH
ncbi:MAG TPA: sulfatase-like hydrolase/transferase, partial [Spirochaetota bacterium]|nr:sulfatase-like hydrolase/transferase [Spirochaetota bacterium]